MPKIRAQRPRMPVSFAIRGILSWEDVMGWRGVRFARSANAHVRESGHGAPGFVARLAGLAGEEVFDLLDEDVAAHVADGFGEGELFGAGLDAVLGEAALLDAAVAGEGAEAFFFEDLAAWVHVEELGLGDGGGADEAGGVVELGADLHADGAGDAVG